MRWTFGASALVICAVVDLTLIAAWAVYYREHYDTIAKVVGGLWTALLALLAFLKIRRKELDLVEFVALAPVRGVIVLYTTLLLVSLPLFALWEWPVHRVHILASAGADTVPLRLSLLRTGDTVSVFVGALRSEGWRLYSERGEYLLDARPVRLKAAAQSLQVPWLSLRQRVVLDPFVRPETAVVLVSRREPSMGTLEVRASPHGLRVLVDGVERGETPVALSLRPGSHRVELRRRIETTDFGYHLARIIQVRAGRSLVIEDTLSPLSLARLLIVGQPGADGAEFYLDTADASALLGRLSGASAVFTVFPGERRVLKKVGGSVTSCSMVTLAAGRQTQILC